MTGQQIIPLLLYLVIFHITAAGQEKSQSGYEPIDISGFYDSAHHWRDITDKDKIINPVSGQQKHTKSEITKIADNILLYQCSNGGWRKNYDMTAILTEDQKKALLNAKDDDHTTFDNGATHSQVSYLAKVYYQTNTEKYKDACLKGLDFILKAQYENGGWPQFYPDTQGYRKYITFNDDAMIGIMKVLHDIVREKHTYSFINEGRRNKVKEAFNKGVECILKCQIEESDTLKVWCQQHDNVDFSPQKARTYELPSLCSSESSNIVLFLMSLENPSKEIINSVQSAVKWFYNSQIDGIKIKTIPAEKIVYAYRESTTERIIVSDPDAPPIWTRFYELKTGRPFFSDRDGEPVYTLAEVGRERRDGYTWYTYEPQRVLDNYPDWREKWNLTNILFQN